MSITDLPIGPPARAGNGEATGGRARRHVRVAIIGAGFGGLGAAVRLRQQGIEDVVVLEKADDVGGTWRDNTYPGCQCDVPSHLYSFSFAPKPDWSRTFAPQGEIEDYLREVADRYGVRRCIRFGHEVLEARWDEEAVRWEIDTTGDGFTADILVSAHGGLSYPSVPDLPGLDRFGGTVFHSAAWRHDHDLTGERVAVVGTGASAIQIVPGIRRAAGHLTVFQRTPAWIVPRLDRAVPGWRQELYRRVPALQRANRFGQYASREAMVVALAKRPQLLRYVERAARQHLERQVADPALRAQLTPDYTIGCKRILLSNDFYPALTQPNVELVPEAVTGVTEGSVIAASGAEHPVDTIVLATGFKVTDHPIARRIVGIGGRSLAEAWAGGMQSYLGTTITGFPNLFVFMGPNTGLGHTSIVFMLESQVNYLADAIGVMNRRRLAAVDVQPRAMASFAEEMQARLAHTVWNEGGCASWYLDAQGRNTTLWPGFTFEYRQRTRHFDVDNYHLTGARTVAPRVPS